MPSVNQEQTQEDEKIKCPKCGHTQIHSDKKGYSGKKACCGALLTGPLGLLCGTHGRNKVMITCLKCRHQW